MFFVDYAKAVWHTSVMANHLSMEKKGAVISALCEGCSIRATERMTGVAKWTILRLLASVGKACAEFHDTMLREVPAKRIQVDEIWSFVGAKQKNVTPELESKGHAGDIWTWVAMDADTKLVCSWMVGGRDAGTAREFMLDLESRLANRVQLTSDAFGAYLNAVDWAFSGKVDYAMLVKQYGDSGEGQKRYSPAECIGCKRKRVTGRPDPKHISTSFVERQNLTMRMQIRRFTRLTNAFSKKLENHIHQIALFYVWYNFARVHQTLRVTPAMEAGISSHVWSIQNIVELSLPLQSIAA